MTKQYNTWYNKGTKREREVNKMKQFYEYGWYTLEHDNGLNKIYCVYDSDLVLVEQFYGTFAVGVLHTINHQINQW